MSNVFGLILLVLGIALEIVSFVLFIRKNPRVHPISTERTTKSKLGILIAAGIGLVLIIIGIVLIVEKSTDGIDYKTYLTSVYPAMDMNKDPKDYQNLFHSLGWYYQCCNSSDSFVHPKDSWDQLSGSIIKGPNGESPNRLRYPAGGTPTAPVTWSAMKCCNYKDYKLPTIPHGHLYDWYSFQYFNAPIITCTNLGYNFAGSKSLQGNHRDISTYVSQAPGTAWSGLIATNSQGDSAKVLISDPMGLTKNIPLGVWAGPGPFYAGERAIMRAMYYPFGPMYVPSEKRWLFSGERDYSKWLNLYLTRSDLESKLQKDQNMDKHWCNGFDENDFVEIGHVQQIPGMASSTGYWFNYFGGGGTGVFHKHGKTPKVSQKEVDAMKASLPSHESSDIIDIVGTSPRNKTHALFNILWEIKNTPNLPQPSGGRKGVKTHTNGSNLLKAFYGTDDPWIITMWYANGYAEKDDSGVPTGENWTQYNQEYVVQGTGIYDFNGFSHPLAWAQPPWMDKGLGPNAKLISRQASTAFMLSIPKLGAYTLPDPAPGNASLANLYGVMGNESSGTTFATLCAFLLQAEFGPDRQTELGTYVVPPSRDKKGISNTLPNLVKPQFPTDGSTGGVGALTYEGVKYALTKVFMSNYFFDRVANGVSFDEPMNYFATVLGYKDIQMPCNTNTNGYWSFETIYIGLPEKEDNLNCDEWAYTWRDTLIQTRQYAFITNGGYQGPAMAILNQLWGSTNSMRDPFDARSEAKSMPCYGLGGFPCNGTPNTKCQKHSKLDINASTKPYHFATKYESPIYGGKCTTQENAAMNKTTTSNVLWDKNDYCHHPWSQGSFAKGDLWPVMCCMGHSFCQAPGDKLTLSSIWSNVEYGGYGYGDGIVPLYGTKKDETTLATTTLHPTKHLPGIVQPPPVQPMGDPRTRI